MRNTTDLFLAAMILPSMLFSGAIFLTSPAQAAPQLSPPTVSVCKGHHQVVAGTVSKTGAERVTFEVETTLCGEQAAETFEVRMPAEAIDRIVEDDQDYILGFTRIRRNPLVRDVREVDPEGPRAIEVPYLGLVLLEDSKVLRELIADSKKLSDKATLNLLTALMQGTDVLHQRFAVAELQLRSELHSQVKRKTSDAVRQLLENPALDPDLHDLLLQASANFPKKQQGPWIAEASRRLLDANGPEIDLTTAVPALLQTALTLLEERGEAQDAALAAKHLASNNPGVVKAALRTASKLDTEVTLEGVKAALRPVDLHSDSRRVLQDYLQEHTEEAKSADT